MSRQEEQHSTLLGVAGEVRDFYARYPYPRPIGNLEKYRRLWWYDQAVFDAPRQSRGNSALEIEGT
jgi:hypothetical protein